MSEFLHMGGYAIFVWSSFGLSALVIIVNAVLPIFRRKQLTQEIRGQIKRNIKRS